MSIEIVQSNLTQRFALPLEDFYIRRIIFWHDEEKEFTDTIDELTIADVSIIKLTGTNNFAVKKLLTADDLTNDYLVYNPFSYKKEEDNWLLDMELYSEVFRADYFSMKMDELHIENNHDMRRAIKLYTKFLENKDRRTALRKMGREYTNPLQLHIDIMAVLCGLKEGSSQDVIIAVVSAGFDKENNKHLLEIKKHGDIDSFWKLTQKYTGYINEENKSLSECASHILLTALSQTISESELKGLDRFVSNTCKGYCYGLVHEWLSDNRRDDLEKVSRYVENELNLVSRFNKMELETLTKADVFPAINEAILSRFFTEINEHIVRVDTILTVNRKRKTTAWFDLTKNYFDCLYNIAKMNAFHTEHGAGFHIVEPKNICKLYTENAYKMDTYYRHFHFAFGNTLKNSNSLLEDLLKQNADYVEGLYKNWYLKELNDCWTNAIQEDFKTLGYISGISKQRNFYSKYVNSSTVKNSKVFVIISDAFRYEVATELVEMLTRETKGSANLEVMQSIFPSITSFGMASLLPNTEISVKESTKQNTVDVFVDGNATDATTKREKILQCANKNSVAIQHKKLLQMKKQERRDITTGKDVAYIYHDAIDAIGDKPSTETKVFEACKEALEEITNIVKIITNEISGTNIFITADHGFLYTYQPLTETQKVSKTTLEGSTYEVGRRYALVGKNTTAEYLMPIAINTQIKGLDMSAYTPKDSTRIKMSGGGENYVHGGVSLQEMIVPVIIYKNLRSSSKKFKEVENVELALLSESKKLSNLIFSLDFFQKTPIGEKIIPCGYSLYFTDDEGTIISDKQTVFADRKGTSASDRSYRVKFNLKSMTFNREKMYRLIIENDTDKPKEIEYKIDIAFASDLDFDL